MKKLSKEEMKKVMGGMRGYLGCTAGKCNSADDCPKGEVCSGGNPVPDCSGTCGKLTTAEPPVQP